MCCLLWQLLKHTLRLQVVIHCHTLSATHTLSTSDTATYTLTVHTYSYLCTHRRSHLGRFSCTFTQLDGNTPICGRAHTA